MRETRKRTMRVTDAIWTRSGIRLQVTDVDTGEIFRWMPTEFVKELEGLVWEADWTTYRHAGYPITKIGNQP